MINPELQKYVDTSFANNLDAGTIKRVLLAGGWEASDIDAAIAVAQKPGTPATPGAPAGTGGSMSGPMSEASAPAGNPAAKKGVPKRTVIAGAIVLLVLIAGAAAFAFYQGGGGLSGLFGGVSDAALLAKLPDNLQAITSATYNGTLDFTSQPREAGTIPFVASDYYSSDPSGKTTSIFQNIDESYTALPADISAHITAGGSSAASGTSTPDGTFHAGADISLADFNASVDADFLKKGSDFYVRINKFPSLFVDLSALKGQWVAITPSDIGAASSGFIDASSVEDMVNGSQSANTKALEQMRLLYQIAEQDGLIVNKTSAVSEQLNGQSTRHFQLSFATDKVAGFYAQATQQLKDKYGDDAVLKFDQATADYLASAKFAKLADYLQKNLSFDLWLDAKTGQLAQFSYSLRIVPPDTVEKLKNIEYVLKFTLALTDVNQPVVVEAPSGAMSLDDAEILISGKSRDEVYAERQVQSITSIREALAIYYEGARKYPDTLDSLLIGNNASGSMKIMQSIPLDIYTKLPYSYRKNGSDYVLEYTVKIPQGSTDYTLQSVVNGTNDATSKTLSTQKKR